MKIYLPSACSDESRQTTLDQGQMKNAKYATHDADETVVPIYDYLDVPAYPGNKI